MEITKALERVKYVLAATSVLCVFPFSSIAAHCLRVNFDNLSERMVPGKQLRMKTA
jgi:hypothetical protein